jgi:hypothetical protein
MICENRVRQSNGSTRTLNGPAGYFRSIIEGKHATERHGDRSHAEGLSSRAPRILEIKGGFRTRS